MSLTQKYLNEYNINLSEIQVEKLEKLMKLVLEKNKQFNLTAIKEEKDFVVKHIIDSLQAKHIISDNSKVLDIGSGAGFPALVLKIANPSLEFILIDSVGKKVNFLNFAIKELELEKIHALHTRIEDYAKENIEKFDFVTSRAVAHLSTLCEYSLPFLKIGGKMIAYKGPSADEEVRICKNCLKILGGKVQNIIKLKVEDNTRNLLEISKIYSSKKGYPRGQNKPRLNPIK